MSSTYIGIGLLISFFVVGAYDIYAYNFLPPRSTVSYVLHTWAMQYPILPFASGVLIGHLFWPIQK